MGYVAGMGVDADVVVVGAGPTGSALAIMLGRAGLQTIVLDRAQFPRDKACGEGLMPAGVRVLEELEVPLGAFPPLAGIGYQVPEAGNVQGAFAGGGTGRGTRRLALDQLLAETAAAAPNVDLRLGCEAIAVEVTAEHAVVRTAAGEVRARFLVGADGYRSRVARLMGWARPARAERYALVGHVEAHGHRFDRVLVTLLRSCEVYLAPTGPDEVLVALLGPKQGLKPEGQPVRAAYERRVAQAHPELSGCSHSLTGGAGPFWTRPSRIAEERVFLVGDAAGFLDPLTGDGMSAGLLGARRLAGILAGGDAGSARLYRHWEAAQWRRRVFMTRLALTLTGSPALARRAVSGLARRPATLDRLLAVNDGSRSPLSLSLGDWAALAGI